MPLTSHYLFIIDNSPQDQKISHYFTQFGFTIMHYADLVEFTEVKKQPAAILIHWQLLQSASMSLKTMFGRFHVPLIVISDTPNDEVAINMLENGADDFIVKPINPRELHARITAINRRIQKSDQIQTDEKEGFVFNHWCLYPSSRQLFDDKNKEVNLSAREYTLLLAFLRQPQHILGREFLLQLTQNSDLSPLDRRIDIQISRLRHKIERDTKKPVLIKTIRNGGYMFTAQVFTTSYKNKNK